jgi:hypothetical protein
MPLDPMPLVSRVGKGRPAGSIELRVSPSPSKIPYGGFSPVRLQMDRQWRPSTTSQGLSAVHPYPGGPEGCNDCCFLFGFSLHLRVRGYPERGGVIAANHCPLTSCVIRARNWRNSLAFNHFRPLPGAFRTASYRFGDHIGRFEAAEFTPN